MAMTWNPADNVGPFVLTAGNLRASSVGVSGNIGIRATDPVTTAVKRYAEYFANHDFDNYYDGCGVVRPDISIPGNTVAGTNGVSVGNNGAIVVNGTIIVAGYISAGNGHVYRQAYDHGAALFWSAVDSGIWNNNALANPATGVGGIDLSGTGSINGHDAVPYIASSTASCDFTARFASGDWGFTAPSGFSEYASVPTEVDLASTHTLGVDMAASIAREFDLAGAAGLGVDMSALLGTDLDIAVANALGINTSVALTREQQLAVTQALGVAMSVTLGGATARRRQPVVCVVS